MARSKAAQKIVVYWRDIPVQVICKAGRVMAKRELDRRFIVAVDACAMRTGLAGTDHYLEQWRKGEPIACGDDLEAEVERAVTELEETYTKARVKAMVEAGGYEGDTQGV